MQEGFCKSPHEGRPLRIGVDARYVVFFHRTSHKALTDQLSIWLNQVMAASRSKFARQSRQPEIRSVNKRLLSLSATGCSAIFVWDGPRRPRFKRGKRVLTRQHWLVSEFKQLSEHYGFKNHTVRSQSRLVVQILTHWIPRPPQKPKPSLPSCSGTAAST